MDGTMRGLASGGAAVASTALNRLKGAASGVFTLVGGPAGLAVAGIGCPASFH